MYVILHILFSEPMPVDEKSISVTGISSTKATISWDRIVIGYYYEFIVRVMPPPRGLAQPVYVLNSVLDPQINLTKLIPDTDYSVSIASAHYTILSDNVTWNFTSGRRYIINFVDIYCICLLQSYISVTCLNVGTLPSIPPSTLY